MKFAVKGYAFPRWDTGNRYSRWFRWIAASRAKGIIKAGWLSRASIPFKRMSRYGYGYHK